MVRLQLRIRVPCRAPRRIHLLMLALLPVIIVNTMVMVRVRATGPNSSAATSATSGVRQFYVSRSVVQAHQARSVCAEGYHFASIWEIADPSSLRYNTTLGLPSPDSGEGPPTAIRFLAGTLVVRGWVRTGYNAWSTDTAGQANCTAWGTNNEFAWGTVANLPSNWTGDEQDIGVWNTEVRTCDANYRVWCVQDDSIWRGYLSIILR